MHTFLLARYDGRQGIARMFQPHFHITPTITKALMEIEACRQAIIDLPLTTAMLDALRETARLLATHYSTQIEGNRLTQSQVQAVLQGWGRFPGRERDEREVKRYYLAVEEMEKLGQQTELLTEKQRTRYSSSPFTRITLYASLTRPSSQCNTCVATLMRRGS